MVDGSPTRCGTGTGAAFAPPACWTSLAVQPFWAKTVEVYLAIPWSLGRVKLVSDAVVLWVSWPLTTGTPYPLSVVIAGPRASIPRVFVTTTRFPTAATLAG